MNYENEFVRVGASSLRAAGMAPVRGAAGIAAMVVLAAICGAMAGLELGRVLGPCAAQGIRGWLPQCDNTVAQHVLGRPAR